MKIFFKVFVSGLGLSFVFTLLGAFAGGILSGFIPFHWIVIDGAGAKGYESGISVVGTIGMVVGGTFGSWLALPQERKEEKFLISTVIVLFLALVLVPGSSMFAREFHLSEYLDEAMFFLFWVTLPLFIARQSVR